jgi:hypothetical protein
LDFEQTSDGLKAEVPQTRKITQPLAAGEVAGIVDRGYSAQGPSLFVVLVDMGLLVIDGQRGCSLWQTCAEAFRSQLARL